MMACLRRRWSRLHWTICVTSVVCFFVIGRIILRKDLMNLEVATWPKFNIGENYSRPSHHISFAETSGKLYLYPREACSIESAALRHPDHEVTLYTIGTFVSEEPYVTVLQNMSNVFIKHLNLSDLFDGTPLAEWHHQSRIDESDFPIEHLSDAVRLAILWKKGGIYLDTDVIVIKSLGDLRNTVALQETDEANGAVLVFDQRSHFLAQCMSDYVQNYLSTEWAQQGPWLISRNLADVCETDYLQEVIEDPSSCQGVTLLKEESFYPIPWEYWDVLFEPVDVDLSRSYTVHLWGKLSKGKTSVPGHGSLLEVLTLNNCPVIYKLMVKNGIV